MFRQRVRTPGMSTLPNPALSYLTTDYDTVKQEFEELNEFAMAVMYPSGFTTASKCGTPE